MQFKRSFFNTYNDQIRNIVVLMFLCTKYSKFKRVLSYLIEMIICYVYNNFFI